MLKYEIKKISTDSYQINIENKEPLRFKKDVKLILNTQKYKILAKLKMIADLKEKGLTQDDFIIKKVLDGKLQEDWTMYDNLVLEYEKIAQEEMGIDLFYNLFNMDLFVLKDYLEIKNNDELEIFIQDVINNIQSSTPS